MGRRVFCFKRCTKWCSQWKKLTSIIETRKLKKQSIYVGFIDFKKAYDSIDRNIMFKKLTDLGIPGYIFKSILSLYNNVSLNIFISFYKHTYTTCNIVQYNRIGTKAMVLVWFLSSNFEINYTNNDGYKLCNECLNLTFYYIPSYEI